MSIPIEFQNLGISQSQRPRFKSIEGASYPRDRGDAERFKDRDAEKEKNQVLKHDRYVKAILLMSGNGERFGSSTPKQFLNLSGKKNLSPYIRNFSFF